MVQPVYRYSSIDSTNIRAMQLASTGTSSGTMVVAGYQTRGRGRLGRDWTSTPEKGLYCSLVVRPQLAVPDYPKITFVAGLAVATFLETLLGKKVHLKWPNDIYISGRKCGGILTESSLTGNTADSFVVVGVGLNINNSLTDFPPALRSKVTSLFLQTEKYFDIEGLYEKIRTSVLSKISAFEKNGFDETLKGWRKRDFLKGKKTRWVAADKKIVSGVALGVDESGLLHVRDDWGTVHQVLSGDVQMAKK